MPPIPGGSLKGGISLRNHRFSGGPIVRNPVEGQRPLLKERPLYSHIAAHHYLQISVSPDLPKAEAAGSGQNRKTHLNLIGVGFAFLFD